LLATKRRSYACMPIPQKIAFFALVQQVPIKITPVPASKPRTKKTLDTIRNVTYCKNVEDTLCIYD
jgi:hypothetical protein